MHLQIIIVLIAFADFISAQIRTETLTAVTPLTATGATVLATGATVTFILDLTTATVSIGPGTTLTLNASSTQKNPSPVDTSIPPVSSNPNGNSTCEVYADPDIIGLGVRLGLYFQLFSNILVVYNSPKEATNSIVQTNIFMTAVFAAILYSVAQGRATPGELIVFMWLSVLETCPYVAIALVLRQVNKQDLGELSFWTHHMITLRGTAFSAFYVWFWFHGLTIPNPSQCREPRVFLFANFGAYGNVRTAFKVFMVLGAIVSILTLTPLVFVLLGEIAESIEHMIKQLTNSKNREQAAPKYETPTVRFARLRKLYNSTAATLNREIIDLYNQLQANPYNPHLIQRYESLVELAQKKAPKLRVRDFLRFALPFALALGLAIMAMELEIRWNDFKDLNLVSQSGQIIPLTIGACALVRAILLVLGFLKGEGEDEKKSDKTDENEAVNNGQERELNDGEP